MIIIKVDLCPKTGIPLIPDEIKERVRNGERIHIEILPHKSGFVKNALRWGVAGLWIDGARVPTGEYLGRPKGQEINAYNRSRYPEKMKGRITAEPSGRWPANLLLSHSPGCKKVGTRKVKSPKASALFQASNQVYGEYNRKAFQRHADENGNETVDTWHCEEDCPIRLLGEQSGESKTTQRIGRRSGKQTGRYGAFVGQDVAVMGHNDKGTAARFFLNLPPDACRFLYQSKASRRERNEGLEEGQVNKHPTVKPVALMKYLCKLTRTPTGGIILDPFMGSGTTGIAAVEEGRDFIGIDSGVLSYFTAKARIEHAQSKARQLELV